MNSTSIYFVLFVLGIFAADAQADQNFEFSLPSTDGKSVSLEPSQDQRFTVVCFLGNECPLARHYARRLTMLASEFRSNSVRVIGVNSNQQDSMEEIKAFAIELEVGFELAKDYGNVVADKYGATRTPEVFVLDAQLTIQYRGRIDNQYSPGVNRSRASKNFLREALEELIVGKPVTQPKTESVGCIIGRIKTPVKNPTVTYTEQISRLIQKHCLECHRTGEIGPFALESYDEVKGWADMMVEVTQAGRMPPWHASPDHRKLANARHLSTAEKRLFVDWLDQGAPYGNVNDLPKKREFMTGWGLPRQPDKIVEMRIEPYQVAATGTVEYQYFVVDPGFVRDTWVAAAEVIPGNRSVVHHSIVFIRPPDGSRRLKGIGWLAAYVPGQGRPIYRETQARLIPAGSKLVFQQHYTPTGTPQNDVTKIGLIFANAADLTHEVYTLAGLNQEFEIPPRHDNYRVQSRLPWFPKNGQLISIAPHMHYRGHSFHLFCQNDNIRCQIIDVPNYDFNWQHNYQFQEPINLADVAEIECEFGFDNSVDNPFNPNPDQNVFWGDQTWEEMAVAFFEIAEPIDRENVDANLVNKRDLTQTSNAAAKEFVDDFFARFDRNDDKILVRDELPRVIGRFKFGKYDINGDGELSVSELLNTVNQRYSNR